MPDTERARVLEALFHDALDRAPEERVAFLAEHCDDEALRREVHELLAADTELTLIDAPSAATLAGALQAEDTEIGRTVGAWTLRSVLGTGGMGVVYLASRRAEFEQRAALKLIRRDLGGDEILARFRHERATLARLEHPGIARLLDGGATDDGRPWLATEYVEGEELDRWCDARGLAAAARCRLFADVCDAVAYAHGQLVVHRDLKPANILVDRQGTPRLLDFGIAKVLGARDGLDAGALGDPGHDEADGGEGDAPEGPPRRAAPSLTREGPAPLTPAYASPEQREGRTVGTAADVYALGVILHELLTGERPRSEVASPDRRAGDAGAAGRVELHPDLGGDLRAILTRALAVDPTERYAHVRDLADDVRRHLDGFPVHARPSTFRYRCSRFIRRHRAASALGIALVVVAAAAAFSAYEALQRDRDRLLDILRLSDGNRLRDLRARMDGPLWPARDNALELDTWLTDARALLDRRALHESRLSDLAARLAAGADDEDTRWWHEQLTQLTSALAAFARDDVFGPTAAAVAQRRREVDRITQDSLQGDAARAWDEARASIADRRLCPAYDGLQLSPQWGLVPLRRDPRSGLWEFRDVQTGEPPEIDADGAYVIADDTALIFVLLPGGPFAMGAQAADPDGFNHDPLVGPDEGPVNGVLLQPYFLSRYEMTQGQWTRFAGDHPSGYRPPAFGTMPIQLSHPVEQMSWDEAYETLRRLGLQLPSEAQWESACRGGTATPWWTGRDLSQLDRAANLADLHARDHQGSVGWSYADAETHDLRDGHTIHAPVGSFEPNPFGLHDVHGNVWEWCRDMPMPYHPDIVIAPDGERQIPESIGDLGTRILRGGGFSNPPERLRSAARWSARRSFRTHLVGVRPARAVEPPSD